MLGWTCTPTILYLLLYTTVSAGTGCAYPVSQITKMMSILVAKNGSIIARFLDSLAYRLPVNFKSCQRSVALRHCIKRLNAEIIFYMTITQSNELTRGTTEFSTFVYRGEFTSVQERCYTYIKYGLAISFASIPVGRRGAFY